jgi:hypothetical protein
MIKYVKKKRTGIEFIIISQITQKFNSKTL